MPKIVGVRFRNTGKSYYFDPGELEIRIGDHVIVDTSQGQEMGTVTIPPTDMEEERLKLPLKEITRVATAEDEQIASENREKEAEAFVTGKEKIRERGLEMKLVQTEYAFDRSKLLFYFTADGRVDFRDLVKDLAAIFRTRIELRQIGVRDETKILGGVGICGRELCCRSFLTDFAPVSIKMAKEQNLSLNPTKISGVCGRLMCCLTNEEETYEYLNKKMPGRGDGAITADGEEGVVTGLDILRQRVAVLFEEKDVREIREFSVDDLEFIPKKKRIAMLREREAQQAAEAEEAELTEFEADTPAQESGEQRRSEEKKSRRDHRDRRDRKDRGDRGDRGEKTERGDGNDRGEKGQKRGRGDRGDRGQKRDHRKRDDNDRTDESESRDNNKDKGRRNGGYRPYNRDRKQ